MQAYQEDFVRILAETGALFFAEGLRLKDGRPTPYFVNLGLFRTGRLSALLGSYMAHMMVAHGWAARTDVVLGPSYKGSALAVATAQGLWRDHGLDRLFEYDRKEVKAHGEASGRGSLFVTNAFYPGARIFIVDDVGTTMGTKYDLLDQLTAESSARHLRLQVIGVGLAVNREQTTAVVDDQGELLTGVKGEDALGRFTEKTGVPVQCLVGIRKAVRYLADKQIPVSIDGVRRPLDTNTLDVFEGYLKTYGVDAS